MSCAGCLFMGFRERERFQEELQAIRKEQNPEFQLELIVDLLKNSKALDYQEKTREVKRKIATER